MPTMSTTYSSAPNFRKWKMPGDTIQMVDGRGESEGRRPQKRAHERNADLAKHRGERGKVMDGADRCFPKRLQLSDQPVVPLAGRMRHGGKSIDLGVEIDKAIFQINDSRWRSGGTGHKCQL
jgi:hypothetical protein